MKLCEFSDAVAFQQHSAAFLEHHEAENNLLLGIVGCLAHGGSVDSTNGGAPFLCTVEEDGKILAAALRTPPHRLVLTRAPAMAVAVLADYLARKRMTLPGVFGPTETAHLFVTAWKKLSSQKIQAGSHMRLYQLEQVTPPPPVSGSFHQATAADFDLLVNWASAFSREIHEWFPLDHRRLIERTLAEHRLFLWKDPQPVSLAAWTAPTKHGARIILVYTPPETRNRGYGSATVATLSQQLLDSGRRFCVLFADLANPTSNRIYQRIGYRPVCDFVQYRFENR